MGLQDKIDFTGAGNWRPYEGRQTDFIPKEGEFKATITEIVPGESAAGNKTLIFKMTVAEGDFKGYRILSDKIPYTGHTKDNTPNKDRLFPILASMYSKDAADSTEIMAKMAELEGKEVNVNDLVASLVDVPVYVSVRCTTFVSKNNKEIDKNEIAYFVTRFDYERNVAAGTHLRAASTLIGRNTGTNGVVTPHTATTAPAAAAVL